MRTTALILTLLVFNVFPSALQAITYYVSPLGNNANTGTSTSKPWQSISKINSKDFKGDTILFQGGNTFTGSMYFTGADIGTSSKPIVIGSYGTGKGTISSDTSYGIFVYNAAGFKINNLIFKGSGRTTNTKSGILFYMDSSTTVLPYLKIDKVEAYGYYNSGISIGSWNKKSGFKDISVTNSLVHDNGSAGISFYAESLYVHKNIHIGYNKAYNNSGIASKTTGNSGSGIVLGHVDGAVVEYCTAYNNGWLHSSPDGGPVGIWAYGSNNVTIQYSESHHNKTGNTKDGGGFDFDGTSNSIMQYNYSHDNYGAGYLLARYSSAPPMNNITVRYNISENDGRKNDYAGIHLWSSGTTTGMKSVQIYNNTVYLTPVANTTPKAFFVRAGVFSGVNVRNNIFQITGAVQIVNAGSTAGFTFQGNNYWSTGSTFKIYWKGTTYSSLASWRTGTGQEKLPDGSSSGLQVDPQFSDTTTGVTFSDATQITKLKRYNLKPSSGLINKGLNLYSRFGTNVGTRDFWGNSLVNKTSFNIGAFQGTPTARPAFVLNTTVPINDELLSLHTFPNPIRLNSTVSFGLPNSGAATIKLYDLQGKLISSLFSGEVKAGETKRLEFNAAGLTNGIYIIHLFSNEKVLTEKVVVRK